jgi:hypothetical protein
MITGYHFDDKKHLMYNYRNLDAKVPPLIHRKKFEKWIHTSFMASTPAGPGAAVPGPIAHARQVKLFLVASSPGNLPGPGHTLAQGRITAQKN